MVCKGLKKAMSLAENQSGELGKLIAQLDEDRSWILKEIDRGRWPELRVDLAALERELGQLLIRASERFEEADDFGS